MAGSEAPGEDKVEGGRRDVVLSTPPSIVRGYQQLKMFQRQKEGTEKPTEGRKRAMVVRREEVKLQEKG